MFTAVISSSLPRASNDVPCPTRRRTVSTNSASGSFVNKPGGSMPRASKKASTGRAASPGIIDAAKLRVIAIGSRPAARSHMLRSMP